MLKDSVRRSGVFPLVAVFFVSSVQHHAFGMAHRHLDPRTGGEHGPVSGKMVAGGNRMFNFLG